MIELGILGPLRLRLDGEEVRLGPSLRALVLALLCASGVPVQASRLGAHLSEASGRQVSEATVRSHVSHLRKVIGDGHGHGREPRVVVSARVGAAVAYALRTEEVETDAARFDQQVDEGEAELRDGNYASAGSVLARALSLWRGAPLADAGGQSYARRWAEHLQDRRRHAVILRAAASVGGQGHSRIAAELQGMVERWPDDEIVRTLHAITLYRSGRSAQAAAACQDAITATQSHGLDAPRLHALQRDVLNGTLPDAGLPHLPWGALPSRLPRYFHGTSTAFHAPYKGLINDYRDWQSYGKG